MGIVQSLVILAIVFAVLAAGLKVALSSDTASFPTRGTAMLFLAVLLVAVPCEAVALVASA